MAPPGPPMPVPSKAAIRALRGLVLGTTCTLALVTEDRRRRINAARSAIRNGDRIRSARRYHPGGNEFAIALEEDSLSVEPAVMNWKAPTRQGQGQAQIDDKHRGNNITRTETTPANWPEATLEPPRTGRLSSPAGRQEIKNTASSSESLSQTRTQTPSSSSSSSSSTSASTPAESHPLVFAYPPPSGERIQRPIPSLACQAEEYRARARAGRSVDSGIIPLGQASPAQPAIDPFQVLVDQIKAAPEAPVDRIKAALAKIKAALAKPMKTSAGLEAAVHALVDAWPMVDSASDQKALAKMSAKLCLWCQKAGRIDLAQAILQLAVKFGQLDEATYFAHSPLNVVQSLAPFKDIKAEVADPAMEEDGAEERRNAFVKRLEDAASVFCPTLMAPHIAITPLAETLLSEIAATGKKLLKCAFVAYHHELINTIYTSIAKYPGDIRELTKWFNKKMQMANDHGLLVSSFVARPPAAGRVSKKVFLGLGDRVVEASRLTNHTKANDVLNALVSISTPGSYELRTAWVTELLYGEWQENNNYDKIKQLFAKLMGPGKDGEIISYVNGVYRVMVQIALEADKPAEAKALYEELLALQPTASEDIRIIGYFALAKAKAGDWQGVREDFKKAADAAADKGGLIARAAERLFVAIAKEYLRTHTIGETEDFLKLYIDEIGMPIGRNMVTLLANEYAALRELRSFVAWIDYCAQAGFTVDAAFSNAILHNCRRHWKFGFRKLRAMYRTLRLLSPNFEDKVTQTIMTHAAISGTKSSMGRSPPGTVNKSRILPLRINSNSSNNNSSNNSSAPHKTGNMATLANAAQHQGSSYISPLSTSRHLLDEHDLHLAMKQAFASGEPFQAVCMYRRAVRNGLPPSDKCLNLAVAAAIKSEQSMASTSSPLPTKSAPDFDVAVDLLKTAHMAGQKIDTASAYLTIAYIDTLATRKATKSGKSRKATAKASIASAVKSVLLHIGACDVQITDLALNRAAFHMFKAGHMTGAIALAMSAASSADSADGRARPPGYNVWNYSVLVAAHARLVDAEGIREATEGAAANGVLRENMARQVLKQTCRRLRSKLLEHELTATVHGPNHNVHFHTTTGVHKSHADDIKAALEAVEEAIAQAREARLQLQKDQSELKAATISIMQQAASQAPVGFDRVRKRKMKKEMKKRRKRELQERERQDSSKKKFSTAQAVSAVSAAAVLGIFLMYYIPVNEDDELIESTQPPAAASVAAH